MKIFFYAISFIILYVSCSRKDNSDTTENEQQKVEDDNGFSLSGSGWDIYTAGTYRYGPSIIINDDGTVDAWFAASSGCFGEHVLLATDAGDSEAISLYGGVVVGQKFLAETPFWAVGVRCPNWGASHCGLTLCLYQWHSDYEKTIGSEPIGSKIFEDYEDNSYLQISRENKFPAGTYLWILKDALTVESGLWAYGKNVDGVTNYYNGEVSSKCFNARYTLEETSGATFWDQASYQHSDDGGEVWTEEEMVLQPTEYSRDALSVCDPGVAKWGGYYYIGYTSTENSSGTDNNVYVCRSANCNGPWEKWNGLGWGGDPQPVIEYTGDPDGFGAGEPCFVVVDDTVYFYYSWNDIDEGNTVTTRVSIADANDTDWPGNLTYKGVAMNKSNILGSDHCDVKYNENVKKFLAIHTASRLTEDSYIVLWESDDGISFNKVQDLHDNLMPYLHNCGLSGDAKGHIKNDVQQYLSYAYGERWGVWNTRWVPVDINY